MSSECFTATAETFGNPEELGLRARSKLSPIHHQESSSANDVILLHGASSNGADGGGSKSASLAGAASSSSSSATQTCATGSGHTSNGGASSHFSGSNGLHAARSFDHLSPFHPPINQSHRGEENHGAWAATPSFTPVHERQQALSPQANGYTMDVPSFLPPERWSEAQAHFESVSNNFWSARSPSHLLSPAAPRAFTPSSPPDDHNPSLSPQNGTPSGASSSPEYSIFVGDLSPGVTEEDLVQQFLNPPAWSSSHPAAIAAAQAQQAQGNFTRQARIAPAPFSSTTSAKIITDPATNASRGFGFVRFGDEADCNRALVEMQGVVIHPSKPGSAAGRPLRVCTATPKQSSGAGAGSSGQASSTLGGGSISGDTTLYATAGTFQNNSAFGISSVISGAAAPFVSHSQQQQQQQQQQGQPSHPTHDHHVHQSQAPPLPAFMAGPPQMFPARFAAPHPGISAPSPTASPPWPTHLPLHQGLVSVPYGSGHGTPVRSGTPSNGRSFAPMLSTKIGGQGMQNGGLPNLAASFAPGTQAIPAMNDASRSQTSGESVSNAAAALDDSNTTVFVGGLSSLISEETLRTFFAPFGEITYVKIPPGKGCGFVQFFKKADAARAIERMQSFPIGGGRIRLSWGRSQGDKAAAAAALANAQAAQISHLANLAGLGNLTPSQLAQLAGITDVLNNTAQATNSQGVHSPTPSDGSTRDLFQAAAGTATAWRPPLAFGAGLTNESTRYSGCPGSLNEGSNLQGGGPPGPVVSELLSTFARLGIEENPSLAKKFLDLARSSEVEHMQLRQQQQQQQQDEDDHPSSATARDELTSGVNWLKSSTFSPFASDDASFLSNSGSSKARAVPQQHRHQHTSSEGERGGNGGAESPTSQHASGGVVSPVGTGGEQQGNLTRKSSNAHLSYHPQPSDSSRIHRHAQPSLGSRSVSAAASTSE